MTCLREIPYEVSRRLVRGLDYYTGTVFEICLDGLGAQDAVAGGGRYDALYQELGGGSVPCTGHSIGMERLLMSISFSLKERDISGFVSIVLNSHSIDTLMGLVRAFLARMGV